MSNAGVPAKLWDTKITPGASRRLRIWLRIRFHSYPGPECLLPQAWNAKFCLSLASYLEYALRPGIWLHICPSFHLWWEDFGVNTRSVGKAACSPACASLVPAGLPLPVYHASSPVFVSLYPCPALTLLQIQSPVWWCSEVDYKGGALVNGLSALLEEAPESFLTPSTRWGGLSSKTQLWTRKQALLRGQICWCFHLGLPSIQSCGKEMCVNKPQSLSFCLQQPERNKIKWFPLRMQESLRECHQFKSLS